MTQPEIIDITDLNNPTLTPIQQQALAGAAAVPVQFDRTAILNAARAETGLSDFGAMDFTERLNVWLQAINEDVDASDIMRINLYQMCVRYAATRLRIEDMIRRHLNLEVRNGIAVDAQLATADPHISAVGDCASYPKRLRGRRIRTPRVGAERYGSRAMRGRQDHGSGAAVHRSTVVLERPGTSQAANCRSHDRSRRNRRAGRPGRHLVLGLLLPRRAATGSRDRQPAR